MSYLDDCSDCIHWCVCEKRDPEDCEHFNGGCAYCRNCPGCLLERTMLYCSKFELGGRIDYDD